MERKCFHGFSLNRVCMFASGRRSAVRILHGLRAPRWIVDGFVKMAALLPSDSSLRHRPKNHSSSTFTKVPYFMNDSGYKKYISSFYDGRIYLIILGFYFLLLCFIVYADKYVPSPKTVQDESSDPGVFVEQRARNHLIALTSMGQRITGSYENEVLAVNVLIHELNNIKKRAKPHWTVEIDIQKPTGSFNIKFQDGFTSCYDRVKNILVKLESTKSSNHSLLINCHYDSAPGSPGASDDAVNCAVLLEVLYVLSQSDTPLEHSIIFSFNGAEENILQAAHGFITQHPWAKNIRAFINLEACGSGGREIVFQAGPGNPWLLEAYGSYAPYPFASVMGQEIFASGVIPSDTDYRIYRDYGKIPGLDIAYITNGYIYHTRYDREDFIPPGTIQRTGENILSLLKHLASSPLLPDPGNRRQGNLVFFDVMGFALVVYSEHFSRILNFIIVLLSLWSLRRHVQEVRLTGVKSAAYLTNIVIAIIVIILSWIFSFIITAVVAKIVDLIGANMSWFTNVYVIFGLYISPVIIVLVYVYSTAAYLHSTMLPEVSNGNWLLEDIYYEAVRLIWVIILFGLTVFNIRSAFILAINVFFPLLIRSFGIVVFPTIQESRYKFLTMYLMAQTCSCLIGFYATHVLLYIFIPIMGRSGANINPDLIVGLLICLSTLFLTSYMTTLIHVMKSIRQLLFALLAIFLITLFAVKFTPVGIPYNYDPKHPTPQRFIITHAHRTFWKTEDTREREDSGYWILPLDYNGPKDTLKILPEVKEYHDIEKYCDKELYCGMPYYFPVISKLRKSYYIPAPSPLIHIPLRKKLLSQKQISVDSRRLTFSVTGPSHMGVFVSPSNLTQLINWSFADGVPDSGPKWKDRNTYFVYYSQGEISSSNSWVFSMDFKIPHSHDRNEPFVDIVMTSHYLHGHEYQSADLKHFLSRFPSWTFAVGWTSTYQAWSYYL